MKKQKLSTEWTFTMPRDHKGVIYLVSDATSERNYHCRVYRGEAQELMFSFRPTSNPDLATINATSFARFLTLKPYVILNSTSTPIHITGTEVTTGGVQEWLLTVYGVNNKEIVVSLQIKPKSSGGTSASAGKVATGALGRGKKTSTSAATRSARNGSKTAKAAPSRRTTPPITKKSSSPSPKPSA